MSEQPQIIVCRDCGAEFRFGIGEQALFAERGFEAPTRCRDCRAARKTKREFLNSLDERRAVFALAARTTRWQPR